MENCVFCKIVAGVLSGHDSSPIRDDPTGPGESEISSDVVFESGDFIVIRDVNPKVKGHMLVIPKRHVGSFMELESEMYKEFLGTVRDVVKQEGLKDFNLVVNEGSVAGQVVDHLHLHILPRVEGDGFEAGV